MKVIAFSDSSGNVSVIHPAPQENVVRDFLMAGNQLMADTITAMTHDQFVDWVKNKDVPAGALNVTVMDVSELPTDRTNRDAWRLG